RRRADVAVGVAHRWRRRFDRRQRGLGGGDRRGSEQSDDEDGAHEQHGSSAGSNQARTIRRPPQATCGRDTPAYSTSATGSGDANNPNMPPVWRNTIAAPNRLGSRASSVTTPWNALPVYTGSSTIPSLRHTSRIVASSSGRLFA